MVAGMKVTLSARVVASLLRVWVYGCIGYPLRQKSFASRVDVVVARGAMNGDLIGLAGYRTQKEGKKDWNLIIGAIRGWWLAMGWGRRAHRGGGCGRG